VEEAATNEEWLAEVTTTEELAEVEELAGTDNAETEADELT
jgi:hypothetical protein